MMDGAKTTMGRTRCAGLALACSLVCAACLGTPAAAEQRLVGTGEPASGIQEDVLLSPRDAMSTGSGPQGSREAAPEPAVLFAQGSAHLTPRATRVLDLLGRTVIAPGMSASRFRLEGHGDGGGTRDMANDLARRRAQAVADYLEQNCAVAASRLEVTVAAQRRPVRQVRVIALPP